MFWTFCALFLICIALSYFEAMGVVWVAALSFCFLLSFTFDWMGGVGLTLCLLLIVFPAALLAIKPLRKKWITPWIFRRFQQVLPDMSDTERAALEAGTTWWDAQLFSGKPDWRLLGDMPPSQLRPDEQAFLDNEVEHLCAMVSDWETTQVWQDLPPDAWEYIKERGFLAMIIPKKYGGKEFSAYMHSQVVMKLASRCSALAVTVMVPNSLGPAELLLRYGSEEQKNYYLPRLATGKELPCFALTGADAGSDAAAIPDVGIVSHGVYDGKEVIGFRITWHKRYITLAPVASLLGLAFRARDPDHLLSMDEEPGITCVLVPTSHPGVVTGRRHWPLNAVFQNGPTSGEDIFIPLDWVIGGRDKVGQGWRMLMECLAAGRAISLPSSNVGAAKLAVRGVSAYVATRRQFHTPIGKFEGVQEALARMGGNLYLMDAMRQFSAQALDEGERPSVISAIAKYHVTERARIVVNNGMDILGGKGICMGPNNFLARAYQQMPIAITVEGANILTRSLIIFGQGAIRCHPYVLREMQACGEKDERKALADFDDAFWSHVRFVAANFARSLVHGLSGAMWAAAPPEVQDELDEYHKAVSRLSAIFALLSDATMLVLGGALKRRESISARLGDVLSQMVLISATLKRYDDEGVRHEDLPYVHWAVQDALYQAQQALVDVLHNFPSTVIAVILRIVAFPLGLPYRKPSDTLAGEVAIAMQTAGPSRERLLADAYLPELVSDDCLAYAEEALRLLPQVNAVEHRLKPLVAAGKLNALPQSFTEMQAWIQQAAGVGLLNADEQDVFNNYAHYGARMIQVDDFDADFKMPAQAGVPTHGAPKKTERQQVAAVREEEYLRDLI